MFRGQVYQQKFDTAMGSPVSPIVANLFMEDLEQRAIESAPEELRPKLWKRYVDDTLEVIKRGKVEEWSTHLNSMDPTGSIKFTYEEETKYDPLPGYPVREKTRWISESTSLPKKDAH